MACREAYASQQICSESSNLEMFKEIHFLLTLATCYRRVIIDLGLMTLEDNPKYSPSFPAHLRFATNLETLCAYLWGVTCLTYVVADCVQRKVQSLGNLPDCCHEHTPLTTSIPKPLSTRPAKQYLPVSVFYFN